MLGYGQPSQQAQPQVIFGEPSDTGFTCISRRRAFQVFLRRDCGRFIREPAEIYHQLCSGLGARHLTLPELCKVMTDDDFQHELALSGKSVDSYPASFLSNFESSNKGKYEALLGGIWTCKLMSWIKIQITSKNTPSADSFLPSRRLTRLRGFLRESGTC